MTKTKKKSKKGIVLAILALAAVLIAMPIIRNSRVNPYSEEMVRKGDIESYYTFAGNVESKNTQNVMADKVMQISEIKFAQGDEVEVDDILFVTSQGDQIMSKISGTISKVHVQEDEAIMAGTRILDIIDFDNLQVSIKIDEYDLSSLEINKEASVTIAAIDKVFIGKLSDISNTAVNQNGLAYFTATLDLEGDSDIKVGMTAEAKILNKRAKDVLMVAMKSLEFNEDDETYVLIRGEKNLPIEQYVIVGINDGKNVEIKEGLVEDQLILYEEIASSEALRQGGGFMSPMRRR